MSKGHLELVKNLKIVNKENESINEDIPLNFSQKSSKYFKVGRLGNNLIDGETSYYKQELIDVLEKSKDDSVLAKLKLDGDLYPISLMKDIDFVVEILLQRLFLEEGIYERRLGRWEKIE